MTKDDEKDTSLAGTKRDAPEKDEAPKVPIDPAAAVLPNPNDFELDPEKRREARKMRRIMANRKSARESRERRKKLLTDLHDSVQTLTSDNTTLTKENLALRRELVTVIRQSGGVSALGMIPNIQAILESAQVFSNLPNLADPSSITVGDKKK